MMSAYSVHELKHTDIEEGAIAFLPKSLDIDKVTRLITEVKDTAILVLEEDDRTARALRDGLKEQGYWVTVTSSPHDALELVEQIRFDLVLIDTSLPSMNGLEIYLATKEITPTAIAIMITGMEEEFEQIAREAVRRNACTIVRKALAIDRVLALLERAVGARASGDFRRPPDAHWSTEAAIRGWVR